MSAAPGPPGELPLSLAACTNQWDVVAYLLENQHQPASLQATDSLGNTVLHALVMIADNSPENSALVTHMYDRLLQAGASLCPSLQLEDIPNLRGLTPLKLAAQEGKMEVSGCPPLSHLPRKQKEPEEIVESNGFPIFQLNIPIHKNIFSTHL